MGGFFTQSNVLSHLLNLDLPVSSLVFSDVCDSTFERDRGGETEHLARDERDACSSSELISKVVQGLSDTLRIFQGLSKSAFWAKAPQGQLRVVPYLEPPSFNFSFSRSLTFIFHDSSHSLNELAHREKTSFCRPSTSIKQVLHAADRLTERSLQNLAQLFSTV